LRALGVNLSHGDLRAASDLETLPAVDWVIDAAANPSVLAGVDGKTSSRQLVEHNLAGTVNLLEFCKQHRAGFILLSTSRVYSIAPLAALKVEVNAEAFRPSAPESLPGLTGAGLAENFATAAPVSLYGATKLASEALALEYGESFGLPIFINRCGVLAGAGQFGRPDQGIFTYWINSHLRRRPLKYIGFDGRGHPSARLSSPARPRPSPRQTVRRSEDFRDRPHRQRFRRHPVRALAAPADRLVCGEIRRPLRRVRSDAAAVRSPLDRARSRQGLADLELASSDAHRVDSPRDCGPCPGPPGLARALGAILSRNHSEELTTKHTKHTKIGSRERKLSVPDKVTGP